MGDARHQQNSHQRREEAAGPQHDLVSPGDRRECRRVGGETLRTNFHGGDSAPGPGDQSLPAEPLAAYHRRQFGRLVGGRDDTAHRPQHLAGQIDAGSEIAGEVGKGRQEEVS